MANWTPVFEDDLEKTGDQDNFFDQGAPEVTIPRGYHVVWDGVRPEFDKKDATIGQPEVHSGVQAGVGFHVFRTFKWWLISDPIAVTPGLRTRGQAALMIVSHGIGANSDARGACGMRVGLVNADEITIDADKLSGSSQDADAEGWRVSALIKNAEATWSKWYVVRGDTDTPEREWGIKRTKKMVPSGDAVRLIIQCNADVAAQISAGHYDDLLVEQDLPADQTGPSPDREALLAIAETLRQQADLLSELAG